VRPQVNAKGWADPMMTVRGVRPDDASLLREVRIRALTDSPGAFGGTLEQEQANPQQHYQESAARFAVSDVTTKFLLFSENRLMGTIGAFFQSGADDVVYLCAMWVDPMFRRRGAGRELVRVAITWGRKRGATVFKAWVSDENVIGRSFWQGAGFAPTSQTQPLPSNPAVSETLYVCR